MDLQVEFQSLFKLHQFDTGFKKSDLYIEWKLKELGSKGKLLGGPSTEPINYDSKGDELQINKRVPFDLYLTRYIFENETAYDVRIKALRVLIKNFK